MCFVAHALLIIRATSAQFIPCWSWIFAVTKPQRGSWNRKLRLGMIQPRDRHRDEQMIFQARSGRAPTSEQHRHKRLDTIGILRNSSGSLLIAQAMFKHLDADSSGDLTEQEFQASHGIMQVVGRAQVAISIETCWKVRTRDGRIDVGHMVHLLYHESMVTADSTRFSVA